MNINIESGANVQITDKPIVNIFGDVILEGDVENQDTEKAEVVDAVAVEDGREGTDGAAKCFKFTSDFLKEKVMAVVKEFYHGSHADLALIEIALYDHGQLMKRNSHTAFVKALAAWGILDVADDDVLKQKVDGIRDKYSRLPKTGYEEWDDRFLNDKNTCKEIGKKLGDSMPYRYKKEQ